MKDNQDILGSIQEALTQAGISAWLFYDFRGQDPLSLRVLGLDTHAHSTRRWFYVVPAQGNPIKLVHQIEADRLDQLPGEKWVYVGWEALRSRLKKALQGLSSLAAQYSPRCSIPYVSYLDAGTMELLHDSGVKVVSSADLIQRIESVCNEQQVLQHLESAEKITRIVRESFALVASDIKSEGFSDEYRVQQFILRRFEEENLTTDFPPIVAANQNSGNPHYSPTETAHLQIGRGDFLLIDLWARSKAKGSVYADITWTAFYGDMIPRKIAEVFEIVTSARDCGVDFLQERFRKGRPVCGWEVDDTVREHIRKHGYADHFVHRTGHNIGQEVHGNGVNFDNLETHDSRQVIPGLICTIEPGVYLPEFGVRSEVNVLMKGHEPVVTTPPQKALLQFHP